MKKTTWVNWPTDKATFNPAQSRLRDLVEVFFQEGDTVPVGEVLAVIEE